MYARPEISKHQLNCVCVFPSTNKTEQTKPNGSKRFKFEIRNKRGKQTNVSFCLFIFALYTTHKNTVSNEYLTKNSTEFNVN